MQTLKDEILSLGRNSPEELHAFPGHLTLKAVWCDTALDSYNR